MKRTIYAIVLLFFTFNSFAQFKREVIINPATDTTSIEFSQIFKLWENYMQELLLRSAASGFNLNKMDPHLKTFWSKNDTAIYPFPDLYYAFRNSYGLTFYPMQREYFIGISKRDTNLYELKTMFMNRIDSYNRGFPSIMLTVPVIKDGDSYTFLNKFSLNKQRLNSKVFSDITYFYMPTYSFNDSLALVLERRIRNFKSYFQIKKSEPISYLVADNMTEMASWFGIEYFEFDFNGTMNMVEGRASRVSNTILSAGGGENYLHEIIHILLKDFEKGDFDRFEEGIACYFGEHVGHDYNYHAKRLKQYLEQNNWVDLSKSMSEYYLNDAEQVYYGPVSSSSKSIVKTYHDKEMKTNFSFIIQAVICDIAYNKNITTVKDLLVCKANNEQEFYYSIEKVLGIKQADLNIFIRNYLSNKYN